MARLYDPTAGRVLLDGRDIRSCSPEERSEKIGFILQDPLLFTGTIRDNILYGNDRYLSHSDDQLLSLFAERHLDRLLARFEEGLQTKVAAGGAVAGRSKKARPWYWRMPMRATARPVAALAHRTGPACSGERALVTMTNRANRTA